MTFPVIIDTDGACDDALAVWLLAASGQAELSLVTTVAGAVPLETASRNMLSLLDRLGLGTVPVYAGAAGPRDRTLETSEVVLGEHGMSGVEMAAPSRSVTGWSAPEALVAAAAELRGTEAVLVALGPLTNIAAALVLDPDLLTRFERVMIMGTATDGQGNITADAEFNTWVDPEAAAAVFAAPGHVTVVGWQACRTSSLIDPALHKRIVDRPSEFGSFLLKTTADLRRFSAKLGSDSYDLADVLAMAVVLDPGLTEQSAVGRIVVDPERRGFTSLVADHDYSHSATVIETADLPGFTKMVQDLAVADS